MSARKRRVVFSPEASTDLRDVMVHSDQRWGIARRREYRKLLVDAIAKLATFPHMGRVRSSYEGDVRSLAVRQHVVIYELTTLELRILRILHHRRDVDLEYADTSE